MDVEVLQGSDLDKHCKYFATSVKKTPWLWVVEGDSSKSASASSPLCPDNDDIQSSSMTPEYSWMSDCRHRHHSPDILPVKDACNCEIRIITIVNHSILYWEFFQKMGVTKLYELILFSLVSSGSSVCSPCVPGQILTVSSDGAVLNISVYVCMYTMPWYSTLLPSSSRGRGGQNVIQQCNVKITSMSFFWSEMMGLHFWGNFNWLYS